MTELKIEPKWGKETKETRHEIRGEVHREGIRACTVILRGHKARLDGKMRWSYEVFGACSQKFQSGSVFFTLPSVKAAAVKAAATLLDITVENADPSYL